MPRRLKESLAQRRPFLRDDDVIVGRAQLLAPSDRNLLLSVWVNNGSAELMAHLAKRHPQTIRRRIRRLLDRVHSPAFLAAARAIPYLRPDQAGIARLHLCQGRSLRQTASAAGLSLHEVRRLVSEVRGTIAGLGERRTRLSPVPSRTEGSVSRAS